MEDSSQWMVFHTGEETNETDLDNIMITFKYFNVLYISTIENRPRHSESTIGTSKHSNYDLPSDRVVLFSWVSERECPLAGGRTRSEVLRLKTPWLLPDHDVHSTFIPQGLHSNRILSSR